MPVQQVKLEVMPSQSLSFNFSTTYSMRASRTITFPFPLRAVA